MSRIANVFKSVSDERLVIDVVAPGFDASMVTVKTALLAGGKIFKVVVAGEYAGRKNKSGDDVPALASDKYIDDFKYEFADIDEELCIDTCKVADDKLFKSSTFFTVDYELDKIKWSVTNGIIRISIPKKQAAVGVEIKPSDNADADSTGVKKVDTPAKD